MGSVTNAILCILFASCISVAPVAAQAGIIFNFQFDNQGLVNDDGPLVGTIVGSGSFTSPTNLAPGTYDLSSLTGFSLTFGFTDGDSYTTANISTPLTGVAVRISDLGDGTERLFFTEGSGAGADGGGPGGSLDLLNGSNFLSFEPSFAGGNFLYIKSLSSGGSFSGRYVALDTAVPEPATFALIGFGLLGVAASRPKQEKIRFKTPSLNCIPKS